MSNAPHSTTTVYFVRHAESDNTHQDTRTRPLTEKGLADRALVKEFLSDKGVDAVLSSPLKRALDTILPLAEQYGLAIEVREDFREREGSADEAVFTGDIPFPKRQWADFDLKVSDGESLNDVQKRNIAEFEACLRSYTGKTIAIGTHGTALSTIINFYDNSYGYSDFCAMVDILPWVVKMVFDGEILMSLEKINLFE